ncbi:hypothetical protein KBC04_03690 [Candidatus Babeliales bacterium]|nr:hypothetical protein [Candidatus Babeliales bacterium]MBP9844170.1 hypothetical protein [Candidatus Babeliales bacterium]
MKNYFGITIFFVMNLTNLLEAVNSKPMMSRIYGNQYTQGVVDTQAAGRIGQLVPTGIFGTNGSVSLAAQVINSQAVATLVLPNGIIVAVFGDSSNSYLVQYTAEGAVNTSFAAGTSNKLTLTGLQNPISSIIVDEQQRFLVAGQNDGSSLPWIRRINTNGTVDTMFDFTDGASWGATGQINQLAIQTSGEVIAVGFNGTNAMLARYTLTGAIDTEFGLGGYILFDGSQDFPTSTVALTNLYINEYDELYVAYVATNLSVYVTRLTVTGFVDISWNSGAPVVMSYLDGSSMVTSQLCMVIDATGDLVVAVPSGSPTVIKAASIVASTAAAGSFANFVTTGGNFGTDSYRLLSMVTSSDSHVYFVGSNTTTNQMAIIRATDAGVLDDTFNSAATPGINFFNASGATPSTFANSYSMSLAPDGQIFTVGAELNLGTSTPYLSCLYSNQYIYQLTQYPQSHEQGTTDSLFGNGFTETNPGVVCPFVGLYRSSMQQGAETVIDLISGNMLIGSSGYTGTNSYTSMILVRLTNAGLYDNTFGSGGKLVLENSETPSVVSEYITSILEDGDQNIYVTGYSSTGALFRKYSADGTLLWNADYQVSGFQGLGVGFEGPTRVLLFLAGPSSTGQINAYYEIDGAIDLRFNENNTPGYIVSNDFGLNMGPLYNGIVGDDGNIFVGYKNSVTSEIDVTAIYNPGSEVFWTAANVFAGYPSITADNVRVSFNADGNVAVAAALGTNFLVKVLNVATGNPVAGYLMPLVITCGTSVQLRQLIGVSDNTLMIIGYDDTTDDAMLVARVAANATLDQTFNSQGPIPGILSIQIGDQVPNYYARVGTGIMVQSRVGINQGNLVASAYEQMFSNDVTPIILRIFGTPGTTQVKNSPVHVRIPGEFDPTYGNAGIAEDYVLGATTPTANQEVRAIRQLTGTNIMTVVTDNNSSISYTKRLLQNSTADTTYGSGLGIAIPKLAGVERVETMVFDGSGNFLVTGSNATFGGFIKRILPTGTLDQSFGGSLTYPLGTVYGIMDSINACQQLTNGNIVIVGSLNGIGVVRMLNSAGQIVTNFGIGGQVYLGVNATSVSVDSSNNIYVAIAYTNSVLQAGILKLNATGQRVNSFGVSGFASSVLAEIDNASSLRSGFDDSGRICVAGSFGGADGQLAVNRITAVGQIDPTFNSGSQLNIEFEVTPTNVIVTSLVTLEDNKILVAGYQTSSTPANNYEFVACVNQAGERDHSFGVGGVGVVTFQAIPSPMQLERRLCNMNVQTNGDILLCGGEIPALNQETPLTMRMYGYLNVQPVPQFTGYQPSNSLPIVLNPLFNGNGISISPTITDMDMYGSSAIDSLGRTLVSGITSDGLFIVARYLASGLLDPDFGIDGVTSTTVAINGVLGGYVAVDSVNRVYVGGVKTTDKLIVARFTVDGDLDTDYGVGGIASSYLISNLSTGGYVTINSLGKALASGYTTDGNFVVTRFLLDGSVDTSFGLSINDYVAYVPVPSLESNAGVVADTINNIFVSGKAGTAMVLAKLDNDGILISGFGTAGIATSGDILGLVQGGALASNDHNQIVLGGLTANHSFVLARFVFNGDLDPDFGVSGIAYSDPVNVLNQFGGITVDNQHRTVVGGVATGYQQPRSMIVARFTDTGVLDTGFTSVGMATTGPITGLLTGGTVVTNVLNQIIIAGLTDGPAFVVAEMYSGDEIFVVNPSLLNPEDVRIYYYGNSRDYLEQVIALKFLARGITNRVVKVAVLAAVRSVILNYEQNYELQPGTNLIWNFSTNIAAFEVERLLLDELYSGSTEQIDEFFTLLETRAESMKFSSPQAL